MRSDYRGKSIREVLDSVSRLPPNLKELVHRKMQDWFDANVKVLQWRKEMSTGCMIKHDKKMRELVKREMERVRKHELPVELGHHIVDEELVHIEKKEKQRGTQDIVELSCYTVMLNPDVI